MEFIYRHMDLAVFCSGCQMRTYYPASVEVAQVQSEDYKAEFSQEGTERAVLGECRSRSGDVCVY